jgi:nucleoside-diphosphate-sugar epimerase
MQIKRILITGGSGFIGLNVIEAALTAGVDVINLDARPIPVAAAGSFSRLAGRLETIEGDIAESTEVAALAQRVDAIIHGSAITPSDANEATVAERVLAVNLLGTVNAARAAAATRLKRMVFLSSAAVYGTNAFSQGPIDEAIDPAPQSIYAVSKFAAERFAIRIAGQQQVSLRILRLGSVFGPWEYPTGLRNTLSPIFQATSVAASGCGDCVLPRAGLRDWIYSRDVAAAVLDVLAAESDAGEPQNIGLGEEWSVEDWCERLCGRFESFGYRIGQRAEAATIDFHGSADRSALAIERLERSIGFKPRFGIEAAFADYMSWLTQHPEMLKDMADERV